MRLLKKLEDCKKINNILNHNFFHCTLDTINIILDTLKIINITLYNSLLELLV